ncbi:MAG: DUF475 domain-containing protein [Deltaproteobacteria bacterium]|nr:DUF475 domain-containing protein [Deltaproteobacteria bacterium]
MCYQCFSSSPGCACSIDNAIINAEVLSTMSPRARRWFLIYGLVIAVFVVRALLPWFIVWMATPGIGPLAAFTATFSNDPEVKGAVERSAPVLLMGGGVFLVLLFFHWLFLEEKNYGLWGESFFYAHGAWFYAVVSIILAILIWAAMAKNDKIAFGAVVGATAFVITQAFKMNAEDSERNLLDGKRDLSDISKVLYLEVIDATFSIDGVLGAFAFTLSVPLILLGNGLGAFVVREFTIRNIDRIKKYLFLKNGAMYSIFFLGLIMVAESFGHEVPSWGSPLVTFGIVGYFFIKSKRAMVNPA